MDQPISRPEDLAGTREQLEAALQQLNLSERLRADSSERERALAAELQHRVRNLLAILRSVLGRTIDTAESPEEGMVHFQARLDAIARHHGRIAHQRIATVDLETMIRDELLNFGEGDGERVALSGPVVLLAHQQAELIAIALHELATNSVKFGALAAGKGRLDVTWRVQPERLVLEWIETGVSIVAAAPLRFGFGREFIEQAVPYQLDAATVFDLRPGGVACRIELPLTEAADTQSEETA